MPDLKLLEKTTIQVRRDILRMVHKVNSGHPGGSLGCAEFFVSLFFDQLEFTLPFKICLLYTSPSPRDLSTSRMPSSA